MTCCPVEPGIQQVSWLKHEIGRIQSRQKRKNQLICFFCGLITAIVLLTGILFFFTFSDETDISVIRIDGTIVTGNVHNSNYAGSEYVGRELREAADDKFVQGIVIRVNSPGGSPAAAQEIIQDIEYAKSKKPVVVSMGDLATSAAYHISAHADLIYANPDTITGNVGTIWTFYDYSKAMEDDGIALNVVKSGEMKDFGSPFRSLTTKEREYAQQMVNESFELFITDVIDQRDVERSAIEDARLVRGDKAMDIGLVDRMGNLYDAIDAVQTLS